MMKTDVTLLMCTRKAGSVKRELYMAFNEKSMLSRHNHTTEIVSQDLAIGRLIPGSNPGILFLFLFFSENPEKKEIT